MPDGGPRRATRYLGYLRLRPFDVSTAEGRGAERQRRIALTAVSSGAARVVAVGTSLAAIPIALRYLGPERYGVWATLAAISTMLVFADLGIGNGLLNLIAEAMSRGDPAAARRAVSTALVTLTLIAVALAAIFLVVFPIVPWSQVINVQSPLISGEAAPAVAAAAAMFVLSIPLGVVQRIQLGMQQGFRNSLWLAVGSILSLLGLLVAIALNAGLPAVVLALTGGPVLALALNWIVLLRQGGDWVRPSLRLAAAEPARRLARLGSLFFVLQLSFAIAYQSDVVIAGHLLGLEAASTYSVTLRLFLFGQSLATMVLIPLWPAYTEAIGRGDLRWVRATLRRSVIAAAILTTAWSIFLVLVGPSLLFRWLAPGIEPPFALIVGAAIWAIVSTTFSGVAMLLNAASVIRFQVITALVMVVVSVALSWLLALWVGLAGIIWGTLIAYVLCVGIPILTYLPRLIARLGRAGAVINQPSRPETPENVPS